MLYLDYAKQTEDGYIMNFFANSVEDLEDISEGKEFVTKNGTNYGVPAPQSVVTITNKDGEKTTYLMGEDGNWIPGVVNPTDYYTKKQVDAKLEGKQDTLMAGDGIQIIENTVKIDENKIAEIAKENAAPTKLYTHRISFTESDEKGTITFECGLQLVTKSNVPFTLETLTEYTANLEYRLYVNGYAKVPDAVYYGTCYLVDFDTGSFWCFGNEISYFNHEITDALKIRDVVAEV